MAGGTTEHLDTRPCIGIIGATSFVGTSLLRALARQQRAAIAFSRQPSRENDSWITWVNLQALSGSILPTQPQDTIEHWILLAPIWAMPDYFEMIRRYGATSVVALSSTSVITKQASKNTVEQATITRMLAAEKQLQEWAEAAGIRWAVLRPTLIYGYGEDKNLSEIARIIRKTHVFPLLGTANGKRQPVHVDDVASACVAALNRPAAAANVYTLSGAEILPYHEMVRRVFIGLGITPRFVRVPAQIFEWAVKGLHLLPRYRSWTSSMAERMNLDMAFSHEEARRDFGFQPRGFALTRNDLP